jgi:alanyl-tRNA synthetase
LNLDELIEGVPKTELVYLRDMKTPKSQSKVLKVIPEKRTHAYLILDRTIFHPKGGGQPSDKGTIYSSDCTLNLKKAIYHRGVVVHWAKIVTGTPKTGAVTCELDWPFRYLIMRRHTAAHLLDHCLSRAIEKRVQTTDSWLEEPCYVGYAGKPPSPSVLSQVEAQANHMISSGGAVRIDFLTGEASKMLLLNAPNFERLPDLEEVRTVTIEGCAPIPCGGTHVANINEILALKVVRAEQTPDQNFRLHFQVE